MLKFNRFNIGIILCIVFYSPLSIFWLKDSDGYNSFIYLSSIYIRPLVSVTLIYLGVRLTINKKKGDIAGVGEKAMFTPIVVVSIGMIFLTMSLVPSVSSFYYIYKNEVRENRTQSMLMLRATDNSITSTGRRSAASLMYLNEGLTIKYVDDNDNLVNYTPSADEKLQYEKRRQDIYYARAIKASVKYHYIGSMAIFILYSSCLCWLYFKKKRVASQLHMLLPPDGSAEE